MRSKRFAEEKIIGILKEHEAGLAANELGRKYGISNTIIYNWKAQAWRPYHKRGAKT